MSEIKLEDYEYLTDKIRATFPKIEDKDIKKIIDIVTDTCMYCFDSPSGCQCWNDE